MKLNVNLSSSDQNVLSSEHQNSHVNETDAPVNCVKSSDASRPHILLRRNARWARRAVY